MVEIIFVFVLIALTANLVNLYNKNSESKKSFPMNVQLPGNLPIITLSTKKGNALNFIIDSGSNISHICKEYHEDLDAEMLGTYNDTVSGLGAVSTGITMCRAEMCDTLGNKYTIDLSISEHLSAVAKEMKASTGFEIHGLLGTDFLKNYNCVIDFKSLEIYYRE